MKNLLRDNPEQLHQALALLSPQGKLFSFLPLIMESQGKSSSTKIKKIIHYLKIKKFYLKISSLPNTKTSGHEYTGSNTHKLEMATA